MKWSILEFLLVPKNQKIVKTCCLLRETSVLFRSASRRSMIASCLCGRNASVHQISIYLYSTFLIIAFAAVQQMYLKHASVHQISICLHLHCRLLLLKNNHLSLDLWVAPESDMLSCMFCDFINFHDVICSWIAPGVHPVNPIGSKTFWCPGLCFSY